jgi:hypothetical protein
MLFALVTTIPVLPSHQPPQGGPQPALAWKMSPVDLEGSWTVVYLEIEGKKLTDKTFTHVMIKDRILSYKHEGKDRSWRLEFLPFHMVAATEILAVKAAKKETPPGPGKDDKGKPIVAAPVPDYTGCYVASDEYFCLAMNKKGFLDPKKQPKDIGSPVSFEEPAAQPGASGWPIGGAPYHSHFVLILRRDSAPRLKSR